MPKIIISPPPTADKDTSSYGWRTWFNIVFDKIGNGPTQVNGFTVATAPDPAVHGSLSGLFSSIIFITDESGGATLAYSNGTNWLRIRDDIEIS